MSRGASDARGAADAPGARLCRPGPAAERPDAVGVPPGTFFGTPGATERGRPDRTRGRDRARGADAAPGADTAAEVTAEPPDTAHTRLPSPSLPRSRTHVIARRLGQYRCHIAVPARDGTRRPRERCSPTWGCRPTQALTDSDALAVSVAANHSRVVSRESSSRRRRVPCDRASQPGGPSLGCGQPTRGCGRSAAEVTTPWPRVPVRRPGIQPRNRGSSR